jgi:hypothetical protein
LSEVQVSLLGIPRREKSQRLFELVNTYAVNPREFTEFAGYTYISDPAVQWSIEPRYGASGQSNFGISFRHISAESCVQIYAYPPPSSFLWPSPEAAPPGRYPGGYTNGVMTQGLQSLRVFRYQPGRPNIFTMGLRISTVGATSDTDRTWGISNGYGDRLFVRLRGDQLSINRSNPWIALESVPLEEWNGRLDQTGWTVDPSKLTMWRFELGWYGAIGSKVSAYLPDGYGEARWIKLHQFNVENRSDRPSFRNPFFRLECRVDARAGCTAPQFINLYGSSVYVDGVDSGIATVSGSRPVTRTITNTRECPVLGLQVRSAIPNAAGTRTENQQVTYPTTLTIDATVDSVFYLRYVREGITYGLYPATYGVTVGRNLTCTTVGPSVTATVVDSTQRLLQLTETDYNLIRDDETGLDEVRDNIKIERTNTSLTSIKHTYIREKLPNNQILLSRALPPDYTGSVNLRFNRFIGVATSVQALRTQSTGPTVGRLYFDATSVESLVRIGLWVDTGLMYNPTQVLWLFNTFTQSNYSASAGIYTESGESVFRDFNRGAPDPRIYWALTNEATPRLSGRYTLTSPLRYMALPQTYNLRVVCEFRTNSGIRNILADSGTLDSAEITDLTWNTTNVTVTEPPSGPRTPEAFKLISTNPMEVVLLDVVGDGELVNPSSPLVTLFCNAEQTRIVDLTPFFGPYKDYIAGAPEVSTLNRGALYVTGRSRSAASGEVTISANWASQG